MNSIPDLDHLKPFIPFGLAAGISFGCLMASVGVPGFSGKEEPQIDAGTKTRGSVFGAAEKNRDDLHPDEAAKISAGVKPPVASDARYAAVKYCTIFIDYAMMAGFLLYANEHYTGDNFSPRNAVVCWYILIGLLYSCEAIKTVAFGDVLAQKKVEHVRGLAKELVGLFTPKGIAKTTTFLLKVCAGEGIIRNFKDKGAQRRGVLYHLFYIIKNVGVFYAAAFYVGVMQGWFTFDPIFDTAYTLEVADFKLPVPNLVNFWFQFLTMSFLKDTICMNILHQIMHRRWYELHYVHHLPMAECCNFNMTFFDFADIILENTIAPFILMAVNYIFNPSVPPHVDLCGFFILAACDMNIHSLNPYTVTFYNPVIDGAFRATISHNLHHMLNTGHYTVWPLHQLKGIYQYDNRSRTNVDGSVEKDWVTYNRVMKTDFPEGRE